MTLKNSITEDRPESTDDSDLRDSPGSSQSSDARSGKVSEIQGSTGPPIQEGDVGKHEKKNVGTR